MIFFALIRGSWIPSHSNRAQIFLSWCVTRTNLILEFVPSRTFVLKIPGLVHSHLHSHCLLKWHLHLLLNRNPNYYRHFLIKVSQIVSAWPLMVYLNPSFSRKTLFCVIFVAIISTISQTIIVFALIPCEISALNEKILLCPWGFLTNSRITAGRTHGSVRATRSIGWRRC